MGISMKALRWYEDIPTLQILLPVRSLSLAYGWQKNTDIAHIAKDR